MTSRGSWFYLATASVALSMSAEAAVMQESPASAIPSDETRTSALQASRQAEPEGDLGTGASASSAEAAKALRRILHLRDGRTLRAIARAEDGSWWVQQGARQHGAPSADGVRWIAIPIAAVESVRLEREVLAELSGHRQRVATNDVGGRVELAGWMLDQGLTSEALRETDALLAKSPDDERVLTLLRTHSIAVDWPSSLSDATKAGRTTEATNAGNATADEARVLVEFAARATRSVRELAVLRLAACTDAGALRQVFARELSTPDAARRAFATLGLRRVFPGQEIALLQERAVLDPAPEVRESAASTLSAARDPSVAERLCENLVHPSSTVRVHASEALGRMGYAAAVEPLVRYLERLAAPSPASSQSGIAGSNIFIGRQIAYVQDYDVEVAQNAAIGRPIVNVLTEGAVLDARILSMQTYSPARERGFACRALESLTHAGRGNNPSAWLAWWKAEEARLKDREQGVSATEAGTSGSRDIGPAEKR